ncbi:MAG: group II intron reverse transcriptase/maturase [Sedimenticola sp.]
MNANIETMHACAPSDRIIDWNSIDWSQCHENVRKLQARIVKATKEGRWGKVKALQRLLTTSFSGKALAVKRVTSNKGRNTPGVDGEIWSTPEAKSKGMLSLRRRGYQPAPLRRIYIPKSNGKRRPLGIPTFHDRAIQALYLLALDPVAETTADLNSYGFRPSRSTADAIEQCFKALARKDRAQWILEGDIRGCFDNISHDWLVANVPMDKVVLRKWLNAGYMESKAWFATREGTPQGGIISPVLANMALDGLESLLAKQFPRELKRGGKRHYQKVNMVRYADDFIITGASRELLEQEVLPLVVSFLRERGLELSPEKTVITHIDRGFDFLGQNVRKYNGKLLVKPSQKNVKAFLLKVRSLIKKHRMAPQSRLLEILNPVIRGWANYHRHVVSKETFSKVDHLIWRALWNWARFRHPNKGRRWVMRRYFHPVGSRNQVFGIALSEEEAEKKGRARTNLVNTSELPIRRHRKIERQANPYDPDWSQYFEERLRSKMLRTRKGGKRILSLWLDQDGICPVCQQSLNLDEWWYSRHTGFCDVGDRADKDNLVLLHKSCSLQV